MKIWQGTYSSWRDHIKEQIDIKMKLLCVTALEQGIDIQHLSHESTFVKASNTQKILLSCIIPVISTGIIPVNSLSYSRVEANVHHYYHVDDA
jgi:hypothetical protein